MHQKDDAVASSGDRGRGFHGCGGELFLTGVTAQSHVFEIVATHLLEGVDIGKNPKA